MRHLALLFSLLLATPLWSQDYQKHVNPMIGTDATGHTFPGATAPFGMVQLSPDTKIDNSWEGCSGYHYADNIIYGFSHTHLSGTGVSDYGDIMLMPTMGKPSLDNKLYASHFSHTHEKASAGFYSVKLDKHNIDVRLTTSTRVGFHEYTFNQKGQANIILDLNHRDVLLDGYVKQIDEKTYAVFRRSEAWAQDQHLYARIEFDTAMKITDFEAQFNHNKHTFYGDRVAVSFSKEVRKGDKIKVKVALSHTGDAGAKLNATEITHWNFDKVTKQTQQLWNKELSKLKSPQKTRTSLPFFIPPCIT